MLLIAAAFGVGNAIEASGLAGVLASGIVGMSFALGPLAVLTAVVLCTLALTELITNNAAAVLMFPVAIAAAQASGAEPRAFAWAVALAASASFLTPVGYQTNTMVYGIGGYRVRDYVRARLARDVDRRGRHRRAHPSAMGAMTTATTIRGLPRPLAHRRAMAAIRLEMECLAFEVPGSASCSVEYHVGREAGARDRPDAAGIREWRHATCPLRRFWKRMGRRRRNPGR
ncbi:MAG: SLC13 family permease [Gemmatimonadota bacterium]|nr:SLC13 family permease [Gemmatimonadota bacterium]